MLVRKFPFLLCYLSFVLYFATMAASTISGKVTVASTEQHDLFFNVVAKSQVEHILDTPDTYLGSVEMQELSTWVMEKVEKGRDELENDGAESVAMEDDDAVMDPSETQSVAESAVSSKASKAKGAAAAFEYRIRYKTIQYIPGLYKLYDESIVNCCDHAVRMREKIANNVPNSVPVTYIHVDIDQQNGVFTMQNDGNGMDVVMAPEHNRWVPELVFTRLLTSTNYDKNEQKIVGGKNGYGFKLVLIWSSYGRIETVDHIRGLKYVQEFHDNMSRIDAPVITKVGTAARPAKPYTKVTFRPDYARLGIPCTLSDDVMALFRRRVYDITTAVDAKASATEAKKVPEVKVKFQGEAVVVRNFQKYVELYIGANSKIARVYEKANERWEYAVALSPTGAFMQVSLVNGIYTSRGGRHVDYVVGQITRKLAELIEKKKKVKVNSNSIKEQLMIFLRCTIVNPDFESQTKDYLNTTVARFGSKCEVSDKFIEKIEKMGVAKVAYAITAAKEDLDAAKQTDGTKSSTIRGLPKLSDAHWAGTARSGECMLILCEGDSAKSGIISGLTTEYHRNTIGVFPLKGKLLNVRLETHAKISKNEEIAAIKKILGLEANREYKTMEDVHKHLRYGRVCIMTDQDLDGSHIKGLSVNLVHWFWPSLARIPGFICFINTPILKALRGSKERKNLEEVWFYNPGEVQKWMEENKATAKSWKFKYYKGLGTSSRAEFIQYFNNMKVIQFQHTDSATATQHVSTMEAFVHGCEKGSATREYAKQSSDDAIDMVFNKKRADERKEWLRHYNPNKYLDTSKEKITYEEFIHNEFIHFSMYDCERSIPNVVDGLKPGQRKALFSAFKRNLTSELKVAQFAGYVAEHSAYHHGEESMNNTIIGMAQNFMGSNTIPLFAPVGQFGTRLMGGKDHASPRYIFTCLEKLTRTVFPKSDDLVLEYLMDDGQSIEPKYYVPILPMVLVNGADGIGTGTSTKIASYSPLELAGYLKDKLRDAPTKQDAFVPYYPNFKGKTILLSERERKSAGAGAEEDGEERGGASTYRFVFKGLYTKTGKDKVTITELPVGEWTEAYEKFLNSLCDDKNAKGEKVEPVISNFKMNCNDLAVHIEVTFPKGKLQEIEAMPVNSNECDGVEHVLKLFATHSTANMNLYNSHQVLSRYARVQDILDEFFEVRLETYATRRQCQLQNLEHELAIARDKYRFVNEVIDGTLVLHNRDEDDLIAEMKRRGYGNIPRKWEAKRVTATAADEVVAESGVGAGAPESDELEKKDKAVGSGGSENFEKMEHLLRMRMNSMTKKNVALLANTLESIQSEHTTLLNKTAKMLWLEELEKFEQQYREYAESQCVCEPSGEMKPAVGGAKVNLGSASATTTRKPRAPRGTTTTTKAVAAPTPTPAPPSPATTTTTTLPVVRKRRAAGSQPAK